ncbi:MAG: DegT/DnrJ/EryC1/StrS family aminotransferase, partial [Treponema sp.]|nr:DegT/DnrJ/EryC1/StrS family aminotransferase [Treponema sp.]
TPENFPNAQKQYSRTITLPLWPDMTEDMVSYVIECIQKAGREHHT